MTRPGPITPKLPAGNREEEALWRPELPEAAGNDSSIRWQSRSQLPAGESRQGCAGRRRRQGKALPAAFPLGRLLPGPACALCPGTGLRPQQDTGTGRTQGFFSPAHLKQAEEAPRCRGMQLRELLGFGDAMLLSATALVMSLLIEVNCFLPSNWEVPLPILM